MKYLQVAMLFLIAACGEPEHSQQPRKPQAEAGKKEGANPSEPFELRPENFVSGVTNPYFSIVPGRKFRLEGRSPEGIDIEKDIIGSNKTKEILGITTQGVWEREFHDGSLVNDSKKWYAQDKGGNVWIFGEDESQLFGGYSTGKGNSWQAGVGNGKAGIFVPGEPKVSDSINSQFNALPDRKSDLLGVSESIEVSDGPLKDCIKIREFPVDGKEEHDYFCKEVGNLSLEVIPNSFGKIQLKSVEDNYSTANIDAQYPEFKVGISEDKAKEIALEHVVGATAVNSIEIQLWENKPAYVVEVQKGEDKKTFVYLDISEGNILKKID